MTDARIEGAQGEAEPAARPGAIALDWWRGLQGKGDKRRPDRAALAGLRRCRSPLEAAMVPAFHDLRRRLPRTDPDRLAAAAIVLAHVREDAGPGAKVARLLGPTDQKDDNSGAMTYGRFRSLLQADTPEELIRAMRRAVQLLNGSAPVADLAESVIYWGDRVRRRWAFEFFDSEPAQRPHVDEYASEITTA